MNPGRPGTGRRAGTGTRRARIDADRGPLLLVVAKAPVPGGAKTRLCPPATPEQAAEIAAGALLDTLAAVAATPGATPAVALTGDLDRAARGGEIRRALRGWVVLWQRGETLADRLAAAHADVAGHCPGRPVLQIGMDTPHVRPALLARALRRLADGAGALLGPAVDGGWWALGLRDPGDAEALRGIPTSRPDTCARTSRALRARGLAVEGLPVLSDVDTMADAVAVAAAHPGGRFAAAVGTALAAAAGLGGAAAVLGAAAAGTGAAAAGTGAAAAGTGAAAGSATR